MFWENMPLTPLDEITIGLSVAEYDLFKGRFYEDAATAQAADQLKSDVLTAVEEAVSRNDLDSVYVPFDTAMIRSPLAQEQKKNTLIAFMQALITPEIVFLRQKRGDHSTTLYGTTLGPSLMFLEEVMEEQQTVQCALVGQGYFLNSILST